MRRISIQKFNEIADIPFATKKVPTKFSRDFNIEDGKQILRLVDSQLLDHNLEIYYTMNAEHYEYFIDKRGRYRNG